MPVGTPLAARPEGTASTGQLCSMLNWWVRHHPHPDRPGARRCESPDRTGYDRPSPRDGERRAYEGVVARQHRAQRFVHAVARSQGRCTSSMVVLRSALRRTECIVGQEFGDGGRAARWSAGRNAWRCTSAWRRARFLRSSRGRPPPPRRRVPSARRWRPACLARTASSTAM